MPAQPAWFHRLDEILSAQRDTLLPKLMSGELRANVADRLFRERFDG